MQFGRAPWGLVLSPWPISEVDGIVCFCEFKKYNRATGDDNVTDWRI